ncbi:HNH endonuclease [Chryseobacterium sp. SIMBA_029]|uniref:HNH endonuclease n=1 Tax=Chryseobacterium sp. SIMBA_029 TaxID=3085772 RepID=UPI00397A00EA
MPDIDQPIVYTPAIKKRILDFLSRSDLKSSDWSIDDIKDIRKFIRDYYRNITRKCFYCRKDISLRSVDNCHVEHIIPKSVQIQFMFEPKNLCIVCSDCNIIKSKKEVSGQIETVTKNGKLYTMYPRSSNAFIVVHPHFDNYDDHIHHSGDIYISKSKKGSYTIHICELNRKVHQYGIDSNPLTQSELFDIFHNIMNSNDIVQQSKYMNKLREHFIKAG